MEEAKEVRQIPIEEIIPNRFQPRINFDEKALNELANSIKQHGIIQPLVVRPLGDKFEIIAGERRYKAATLAGLSSVPAIITQMDDDTSAEVALVENVQRKDLTSIEEAKSYKTMLERGNMTQEELAKKMGLSQSTIANKLRLLNLSNEVQDALLNEKISERHARALLSLPNKEDQVRWLDRIINERLTVRQLDLAIKDEQSEKVPVNNLPVENDVPLVNINPDIDQIINNAVDINPVEEKPKIDLFNGMMPNIEPVQEEANVMNNVNETQTSSTEEDKMPNKFFNFLEDEEVNMNFEDSSAPAVDNNVSNVTEKPMETFSFKPEFETQEVDNQVSEITQPDAPSVNNFEAQNNLQSVNTNDVVMPTDSIFMPDLNSGNETPEDLIYQETPVQNDVQGPSNVPIFNDDLYNNNFVQEQPQVEESIFYQTANIAPVIENESFVEEPQVNDAMMQPETIETNSEPVQNQFFNVEIPSTGKENNQVIAPVIEQSVNQDSNNISTVEPIPAMSGDNVVDPVTYFDTLDPQFIDKIKESEGLDLKTAINEYRNVTAILNSRGFNISIDEADEPEKYHIVIDIDK